MSPLTETLRFRRHSAYKDTLLLETLRLQRLFAYIRLSAFRGSPFTETLCLWILSSYGDFLLTETPHLQRLSSTGGSALTKALRLRWLSDYKDSAYGDSPLTEALRL